MHVSHTLTPQIERLYLYLVYLNATGETKGNITLIRTKLGINKNVINSHFQTLQDLGLITFERLISTNIAFECVRFSKVIHEKRTEFGTKCTENGTKFPDFGTKRTEFGTDFSKNNKISELFGGGHYINNINDVVVNRESTTATTEKVRLFEEGIRQLVSFKGYTFTNGDKRTFIEHYTQVNAEGKIKFESYQNFDLSTMLYKWAHDPRTFQTKIEYQRNLRIKKNGEEEIKTEN
jgi:hypothetical protein